MIWNNLKCHRNLSMDLIYTSISVNMQSTRKCGVILAILLNHDGVNFRTSHQNDENKLELKNICWPVD